MYILILFHFFAGIPNSYDQMMDFVCPSTMAAPKDLDYEFRIGNVVSENCGAPCYGMFFNKSQIGTLNNLVGIWAIVSSLACFFTLCTYFIDPNRFPYPQMAIVHMSACYFVVCLIFVIGFALGDGVSCGEAFEPQQPNLQTERLIRQGRCYLN